MKKNAGTATNIFDAAEKGDLQTVTYLVNQKGISVNSRTSSGGTALMKAAEFGNLEVIKFLLEKGANINQSDKYGYTALLWAADKHLADVSTIKYLVERKASITAKDNYRGYSPLHWVAQHGDLQMVKYLVEKGAPIDDKTIDGETPVQLAAAHNRFPVLEYFLDERKAKFDIFQAAEKGYTKAVQYFIERKKKPATAVDADGWSVLHRAAYGGALDTVEFLVEKKRASVHVSNSRRKTPVTPLHAAAEKGHLDIATYLVKKGADPNVRDFHGRTPLYWASYNGHKDVVEYFIDTVGSDPEDRDSFDKTLLHAACYRGTSEVARYLVEQKRLDTNSQDNEGRTPLMECIRMGNNDVLQYLMEQKMSPANVTLVDKSGNNAVHYAAAKSDTNTMKELVKMGFDDKLQNHKGQTPLDVAKEVGPVQETVTHSVDSLDASGSTKADERCSAYKKAPENGNKKCLHVAAAKGDLALVKSLVRKGENINEIDEHGQTALYYAVEGGNLNVVRFLANEKGANVQLKYKNNLTLLHVAAISDKSASPEILKYLVMEKRMNVNEQDDNMETPLFKTAKAANFYLFKFLVQELFADYQIPDAGKNTCSHWLAIHGDLSTLKWLFSKGDDVNPKNTNGRGVLWFSVENHHFDIIRYLVDEKKLDVNERDNDGNTLLHVTTIKNLSPPQALIKYLVNEKKLNVNERNKHGQTPAFMAAKENHFNLSRFFLEEMSADFRIRDADRGTIMHWAGIHGNLNMIKYLVAKEDDINATNGAGRDVLWFAVEHHRFDSIHYLIDEKKMNVNERDNDANTLVHVATFYDKPTSKSLMKYLINDKKLNVNERNKFGQTPAFLTARNDNFDVFRFLVEEMSADFRIPDNYEGTCLHWTAIHGDMNTLKWLIAKGDDVTTKNLGGRGALWYAVEHNRMDVIRYLIVEKKLPVRETDNGGNTLLHVAVDHGYVDIAKYLVEEIKLDLDAKDKNGKTPLALAVELKKEEMVEYLKSKGARPSRRRRDVTTAADTLNEMPIASNAASKHYSAINCAVQYVQKVVASTRSLSTVLGSSDTAAAKEFSVLGFTYGFLLLAEVMRAKLFGSKNNGDRAFLSMTPANTMWPSPSQHVEGRIDPHAETAVFDSSNFFEVEN